MRSYLQAASPGTDDARTSTTTPGEDTVMAESVPTPTTPNRGTTTQPPSSSMDSSEESGEEDMDDESAEAAPAPQANRATPSNHNPPRGNVSFGSTSIRSIPGRSPPTPGGGRVGRGSLPNPYRPSQAGRTTNPGRNTPPASIRLRTRAIVNFVVNRDDATIERLHDMATELYQELKEIDPTVALLPWWPDSKDPPIRTIDDLPRNEFKLRRYIDRFRIPEFEDKERTKTLYTSVYIFHQVPFDAFTTALARWRHEFRRRPLQCAKTAVIGWGLYSTRNMDTTALTAAFQAQNINLHCRWRSISQVDGRNVAPKDVVKAIHFECDSASYSKVQKMLYTLYATTKQQSTDFPLGYRMRLVPDLAQATSSQLPKIQMLLSRQRTFHTMTAKHTQYWGTTSIDYVHPKLGKSVREVLMTSAAPTHPDNTTLISARVSAGTLTIDCLINNEGRAKELLNGIVPYTRYFFESEQRRISPDGTVPPDCLRAVESLFATSLVQASADQTWDPRLDGVITAQDSYIDEIAGTKHDMFDFREMEDVVILPDAELTAHQQHVAELAQ